MIRTIKRCFIILISFLFIQCLKPDCEKSKKEDMENECIVILEDDFASAFVKNVILEPKGINPETGEHCKCKDFGRWWGMYQEYMEKGDTLVKRRGEDFFTIHKKDTIIRIEWGDCDEDNEYVAPKNNPPQIDSGSIYK